MIEIIPENPTDLYILSNILDENDQVSAKTSRRVRRSGSESRSGEKSDRVTVYLGISLIDRSFHEYSFQSRLRLKGTIIAGPEDIVSRGEMHTLNIESGLSVKIVKKEWNRYHLKMLEDAGKAAAKPKFGILIVDTGLSVLAMIDNYSVYYLSTDKHGIPRKSGAVKKRKHEKSKFFDQIKTSMENYLPEEVKVVVIAGPGFVREQFLTFIQDEWKNRDVKFILETTASSGKNGVSEVLRRGIIEKLASDLQLMQEIRILEKFEEQLAVDGSKVTYGTEAVKNACSMGAATDILLLDTFFRSSREKSSYQQAESMIRDLEKAGGKYLIINEHGINAKRLKAFGGVIAILRWSVE